jgi:hypothetical protein
MTVACQFRDPLDRPLRVVAAHAGIVRPRRQRRNTSYLVQTTAQPEPSLPYMRPGAVTPEELESLLEDGFVLGGRQALAGLFEAGGVLCAGPGPAAIEARGSEQITLAAGALCERGFSYLAGSQRVLQAGDTALVVARRAVNVMRRGADRRWRYAVAYLTTGGAAEESSR